MDELIERSLTGPLPEKDRQRLDEWRKASPENERHYQDTRRLLEAARVLGKRDLDQAPPAPVHEILAGTSASRSTRNAGEPSGPGSRRERAWRRFVPWGVAAAAILALAFQSLLMSDAASSTLGPVQVVTGPGEVSTVELDDGSVARLAPSSRLQVVGDRNVRSVRLRGTAFFSVAEDARPFEVVTDQATARVLGTRFEVSDDAGDLRLSVVEGLVSLESPRNRVEVGPGEFSVVSGQIASAPRPIDPGHPMPDWTGRFLAFRETPLREAVREIGAVYGVRIEITAPELERRTVTASFTGQRLEEVLEVICTVVNASCETNEDPITMSIR